MSDHEYEQRLRQTMAADMAAAIEKVHPGFRDMTKPPAPADAVTDLENVENAADRLGYRLVRKDSPNA